MAVFVGWSALDARAAPMRVAVGWSALDTRAAPYGVQVGWSELDVRAISDDPVPNYYPGAGVARYHVNASNQYDIPLDIDLDEEEEVIASILMEIIAHVF